MKWIGKSIGWCWRVEYAGAGCGGGRVVGLQCTLEGVWVVEDECIHYAIVQGKKSCICSSWVKCIFVYTLYLCG